MIGHFIRNAKKQLDTCASSILPAKTTWSDSPDIAEELPLTRAERQTSDRQKRKRALIQAFVHLWKTPERLNKEETKYLQRTLKDYPTLESVYQTIQKYRTVVEARDVEGFLQWLKDQLSSRKQPFYYYTFRLRSDIQAVKNALTLPFSNGLLE